MHCGAKTGLQYLNGARIILRLEHGANFLRSGIRRVRPKHIDPCVLQMQTESIDCADSVFQADDNDRIGRAVKASILQCLFRSRRIFSDEQHYHPIAVIVGAERANVGPLFRHCRQNRLLRTGDVV